jgi:two-component system, cell cycle response regulator
VPGRELSAAEDLRGLRVLVAHHDVAARTRARHALHGVGCQVLESHARDGLIPAAIRRHRPDVVLLEAARDPEGATLHAVKSDPELFATQVVLLGHGSSVEEVLSAQERGAHDVLPEAASAPEIVARVRAARRAQRLQQLVLARASALEDLAYTDELTGLANRRFVLRQLQTMMSQARRHGDELALLLVDADRFKALNDRHGHLAGDEVLRAIASALQERLRGEDLVGRLGGEEFVVAVLGSGAGGAAASVGEALRAQVASLRVRCGAEEIDVTVSVGWAVWSGEEVERLIDRADAALYQAKAAGRDCVRGAVATEPLGASG